MSNGQRITLEDIQDNIRSVHYFTASDGVVGSVYGSADDEDYESLDLLTFCVLIMQNGYTVTGQYACVSPENFSTELGKKIAYDDAISKIWPLMGYNLKESLYQRSFEDVQYV